MIPRANHLLRTECSARMADSMIRKLRRLIEPDAEIPRHLRTVRGGGYVLLPNPNPTVD